MISLVIFLTVCKKKNEGVSLDNLVLAQLIIGLLITHGS